MFEVGQKWYGLNIEEISPFGEAWKNRDSTDIQTFLQELEIKAVQEGEAVCHPHQVQGRIKRKNGLTIKVINNTCVAFDFVTNNYFPVFPNKEALEGYCKAKDLMVTKGEQIHQAMMNCKESDKILQIMKILEID